MYSLLLIMTRCFCLLIRASPSLVSARSPRATLSEDVWFILIHLMVISNSRSSHWACAESTTLISPFGPLLVGLTTFTHMLSSISVCCKSGLFQIFYVEIIVGKCSNPSVSSHIKVWCSHHIHERIVVSPHQEGFC